MRYPRLLLALTVAGLIGLLAGPTPQARSAQPNAPERYFPETGHKLEGKFLQYWNANGGLERQGFPITEPFQEESTLNGKVYTVQYFERAVFEEHPENKPPYDVLLSQLGNFWLQADYPEDHEARVRQPGPNQGQRPGETYFQETGHWVPALFLAYWQRNGGLSQFGFPLSEVVEEKSKTDGKTYDMQYFERAVFEHHPENANTPYVVLLRLLGRDELRYKYPDGSNPGEARRPAPKPPQPAPPAGNFQVDTGFRASKHGFSFENYTSNYPPEESLSPESVRRMFGEKAACARIENGQCILNNFAETWRNSTNKSIAGGHCYGFAAASLRLFKGADNFGAPTPNLEKNEQIRDYIARNWALQIVDPVSAELYTLQEDPPSKVLPRLVEQMRSGDLPVLAYWNRGEGEEGHAVTPWGVEDKGNGIFWVRVYDNNFPGDDSRYLEFNTRDETWKYDFGALNAQQQPDIWTGKKGLATARLSTHTKSPVCPWCGGSFQAARQSVPQGPFGIYFAPLWNPAGPAALNIADNLTVFPTGRGRLMVKDAQGRRAGINADGQIVKEIPGAIVAPNLGGIKGVYDAPRIILPKGVAYELEMDGVRRDINSIDLYGAGIIASVDGIRTKSGQKDRISLDAGGTKVNYVSNDKESPTFRMVVVGATEDYMVEVEGLEAVSGEQLQVGIDPATGRLAVRDAGAGQDTYELTIWNETAGGEQVFYSDNLSLDGGETEYIDVDDWDEGETLRVEVDTDGDGDTDETEVAQDEPLPPDETGVGEDTEGNPARGDEDDE